MESDRWMGLMAMVLIHLRGLPEPEIQQMLSVQKAKFKGYKVLRIPSLPLYCFDMHTRVGKMALSVWSKNYADAYNFPKSEVSGLVFHYLSAITGSNVTCEICDFDVLFPSWDQQLWYHISKKEFARLCGRSSPRDGEALWEFGIKAKILELIKWALSKQEE
jgi:hypothetical protein